MRKPKITKSCRAEEEEKKIVRKYVGRTYMREDIIKIVSYK